MKLSKLSFAFSYVLIPVFIFICLILLLGCDDNQDIAPLPQAEPSLSSERYSEEYTVEQAIRIFKSGDRDAINKVLMSEEAVIWDGKSKFKNGVSYRIRPELNEKAREMNENFRRADNMDRAWQHGGPTLSAKEIDEATELMKEFKFYVQCDIEKVKKVKIELYQGGKMEYGKVYIVLPKMRQRALQENPEWRQLDARGGLNMKQ